MCHIGIASYVVGRSGSGFANKDESLPTSFAIRIHRARAIQVHCGSVYGNRLIVASFYRMYFKSASIICYHSPGISANKRRKMRIISSEGNDVLFHSFMFQFKCPSLLPFPRFERDESHLNASRLRSEYLIKTSERLFLFRWQQTRLHSPRTSANKGEEIRSIWSEGDDSKCNQTLLTIQNTDHSHTNAQFNSIRTSRHHDGHKHGNILTIICKGKRGRRIEDRHHITYHVIIYSLIRIKYAIVLSSAHNPGDTDFEMAEIEDLRLSDVYLFPIRASQINYLLRGFQTMDTVSPGSIYYY
jgi:hypothetical protein